MRSTLLLKVALALAVGVFATACDKDTNNATPDTVAEAQKQREQMIDNDKTMTPEQKDAMKRALRITPGGPPGSNPKDRGSNPGK